MDYEMGFNKPTLRSATYPVILYQLIRQYSSPEDKLAMNEIENVLEEFWKGDKANSTYKKNIRRTIKRNLVTLIILDPNIRAERSDGTEIDSGSFDSLDDDEAERFLGEIKYVWYEQSLSSTDLQLLTDAVVSSRHLTNTKRREILDKIFNATGTSYATQTAWYRTVLEDAEERSIPVSTNIYRNLEFINAAIEDKLCIFFNFCYSGPRNEKYTVSKYTKVSPYKIVLDNGTYYLIASVPAYTGRKSDKNDVLVIEIHKLDRIGTDVNSKFVPLDKTDAAGSTIAQIMINYKRQGYFMFYFGRRAADGVADIIVNAQGLDILIDRFGHRVTRIQRLEDNDPDEDGDVPELRYTYSVTLTNMIFYEWDELAFLKMKYPRQIRILEPYDLLECISHQINYINKNFPDGEEKPQDQENN